MLKQDDRAPKRIQTGKAYLVLLGTMLDAGRREEMASFEELMIRYIDHTLVHIPTIEKGRVWRVTRNKLQFSHH
jgi:hypothetical protein